MQNVVCLFPMVKPRSQNRQPKSNRCHLDPPIRTDHCRFQTIDSTGNANAIPECPKNLEYWSNVMDSILATIAMVGDVVGILQRSVMDSAGVSFGTYGSLRVHGKKGISGG